MDKYVNFIEIDSESDITFLNPYLVKYFLLTHPVETYGFTLYKKKRAVFSYVADTLWNTNVSDMLKEKPFAVIIDLNGKKNDMHKVHISVDDLVEKGLPLTEDSTIFYGTHLKDEFLDKGNIICNKYKNIINIDERAV